MKLYFAGRFWANADDAPDLRAAGVKYKLYSYHHEKTLIPRWGAPGLIIDSGAFSAHTSGVVIRPQEYVEFLFTVPVYDHAIQLDVIGDVEKSWRRWVDMERMVPTLPVIHHQASASQINRVLDAAVYVCCGGLVGQPASKVTPFLDYVFSRPRVRNQQVKIHLLGVMSKPLLERYYAYSADSSSALSIHRYPKKDPLERVAQKTEDRRKLSMITINQQLHLQKHLTELWTKRGITWQ